MINQKHFPNKIDNNNNMNRKITIKTKTKTKSAKQILLAFYVTSSILILTSFSIFSVQNSLGQQQQQQQLDENPTINIPNTISNTITNTTSFTDENKKPMHVPNQIVVVAEDIEEIKDNLQEAREALNNANYLQVLSHINNIDKLLTAFVVSGSLTDVISNNSTLTNNTIAAANDSTDLVTSSSDYLFNKNNVLITIEDINDEQKINKQLFYPNNLKISKGTSITWLNKDNLPHTITLKKLNEQPQEFKFALSLGDSYKHTFEQEGIYGFYSDKNKWSEGKITVS